MGFDVVEGIRKEMIEQMVRTAGRYLIVLVALMAFVPMVNAQGLKGAPSCIRRLTQTPPLLPGASDELRWGIFLKSQRALIGMTRSEVSKLFGSGATSPTKKEIAFRLTEEKLPAKKGQIAYLELTLKFEGERVSGYCVEAVRWG